MIGQAILLRSVKKYPRQGWEEQFQKAAVLGESPESDLWEGLKNDFDTSDWTW